jgi:hypothetical protein
MPLTLRLSQGYALTYQQLDDNFTFITASFVSNLSTGSFALTSSNQFTGSQFITGSLTNGGDVLALGVYSHAEGYLTTAVGDYSHAEGKGTTAANGNSHAEGYNSIATGDASHAEGEVTLSEGISSHAEGYSTTSIGSYSHAEGDSTTALGFASHTEGTLTTAIGNYSHTEGINTTAVGNYSHTGGVGTIAAGDYQTVIGTFNDPADTTSPFIVGVGGGGKARNGFKVTPSGSITMQLYNAAPTWAGQEGEIVFFDDGLGNIKLYAWDYTNLIWKSISFT